MSRMAVVAPARKSLTAPRPGPFVSTSIVTANPAMLLCTCESDGDNDRVGAAGKALTTLGSTNLF